MNAGKAAQLARSHFPSHVYSQRHCTPLPFKRRGHAAALNRAPRPAAAAQCVLLLSPPCSAEAATRLPAGSAPHTNGADHDHSKALFAGNAPAGYSVNPVTPGVPSEGAEGGYSVNPVTPGVPLEGSRGWLLGYPGYSRGTPSDRGGRVMSEVTRLPRLLEGYPPREAEGGHSVTPVTRGLPPEEGE